MNEIQKLLMRLLESPRYHQAKHSAVRYNCPLEKDDIVAEFHRGVLEASQYVKMDVGDPMEYLISRGLLWVKRCVRKELTNKYLEECMVCGKMRPYRQEGCARCGSRDFLLHPRLLPLVIQQNGTVRRPEGLGNTLLAGAEDSGRMSNGEEDING